MAERSTNNNWGGLGLALIALITALGGIGGFVALYNVYQNANACSISGTVYDNGNNNRPVADAFIDYKESHNLFTRLATTAPDGHFDADCSNVPSNYPFRELRVGVSLYISSQNGNCIN